MKLPTFTAEGVSVHHSDCMEFMRTLPDAAFDLAIVDPPYGIGAENHAGNATNGWTQWDRKDWDSSPPDSEYFMELFRVSKHQIIWGANYFPKLLNGSSGWIVWDKGQRDFSLSDGELAFSSFDKALRIFSYSRAASLREGKIHPTQKPIALYAWILNRYAKPSWSILDTHLGSGSIAIACREFGCSLTAMEIDADYFTTATARIANAFQQPLLFSGTTVETQEALAL